MVGASLWKKIELLGATLERQVEGIFMCLGQYGYLYLFLW